MLSFLPHLLIKVIEFRRLKWAEILTRTEYIGVSQPPGRGPVPGPGINYTGPREVLLEFVILVF